MARGTFWPALVLLGALAPVGCAVGADDPPGGGDDPDGGGFRVDGGRPPPSRQDGGNLPGADDDGDGVDDVVDNCPQLANANQADADDDEVGDACDNCPALSNSLQTDADQDRIGDDCDCDRGGGTIAALLVVDDSLSADNGNFEPATGFAGSSWSFTGGAYRQTRLVDNATDATFLRDAVDLRDVLIQVRASSTEIQTFASNLRQIMIVARASSAAGAFSAQACGIEVDDALSPTQRTSALTLGGAPGGVTTTVKQQTAREAVQVNELFDLEMRLQGDTMTCTANLNDPAANPVHTVKVTSASGAGLPAGAGAVGFYTRETKALFKSVRICSFP